MSGYILGVIGSVLVSAALAAILPEGKTNALIKSIMKIVCIFTIVAPIADYIGGFGLTDSEEIFGETVINPDAKFIDYCSKISVEKARETLEKELEEEFSVEVTIDFEWRYENGETSVLNGRYENLKIEIVKAIVKVEELSVRETMKEYILKTGIREVEFG